MFSHFNNIRTRFLLLLALVFVFVFSLSAYRAYERRDSDIAQALYRLQLYAESIKEKQNDSLNNARQLVSWLHKTSNFSSYIKNPDCHKIFSDYLRQDLRFADIFIADANGNVVCNALQATETNSIADRSYFKKAITSAEPVIGGPVLGRFSKKWMIPFAQSFQNASGQLQGVMVVGIDLAWVNNEFNHINLPEGARLGLIDSTAKVLARHPDPENMIGQRVPDQPFFKKLIAQQGRGTAEVVGFDNVNRIYAFTHFAEVTEGPIYLWVGYAKESITAAADRQFTIAIIMTLALAGITFIIMWYGAERWLMQPIGAIIEAANKLSKGNFQARSGLAHTNDEIGQLARVFDEMAHSLLSKNDIMRLNRALKLLSECNRVVVHAKSEKQLLDSICKTIAETGEYKLVWIGFADDNAEKSVSPVASCGDDGYLQQAKITWDDTERGRGPTGTSIRTCKPQINHNFEANAKLKPWLAEARKRGFQSSSAFPLIADGKAFGALTIYATEYDPFNASEVELIEQLATDLSFGILAQRAREKNEENQARIERSMEATVQAIATTLEMRDPYTAGHELRVSQLSVAIAQELGMSKDEIRGIELAANVHDLGKIQVPAEILVKPTKLTELEYKLLQLHPQAGFNILKGIDFPWPIADMVLQHHERMDGTGYPQGLKGDEILIGARILAVADVVEAMASHRPYRPSRGIEAALDEIANNRGKQYDAATVDACLRLFKEKNFSFKQLNPDQAS